MSPYNNLTPEQGALLDRVLTDFTGRDCLIVLVEADGTPEDKAAVAEVLGGAGAGKEFLTDNGRAA